MRKVEKIPLDQVASVQAGLRACACGGKLGKHACYYSEAHEKWMHSWGCVKCGKRTGSFKLLVFQLFNYFGAATRELYINEPIN